MLIYEDFGDKFLAIVSMGMIVAGVITCFLSMGTGLSFVALGVAVISEV